MSKLLLEIHSRNMPLKSAENAAKHIRESIGKDTGNEPPTKHTEHKISLETSTTKSKEHFQESLPKILATAPGQKMRWGKHKIEWYRPIDAIVCTYDGELLSFQFGHIQSRDNHPAEEPVMARILLGNAEWELKWGSGKYEGLARYMKQDFIQVASADSYDDSEAIWIPKQCDPEKVKRGYLKVLDAKIEEMKHFIELDREKLANLSPEEMEDMQKKEMANTIYFMDPEPMTEWDFVQKTREWCEKKVASRYTGVQSLKYADAEYLERKYHSFREKIIELIQNLLGEGYKRVKAMHGSTMNWGQLSTSFLCCFFRMEELPLRPKYDPYGLGFMRLHFTGENAAKAFGLTHEEKEKLWKFVVEKWEFTDSEFRTQCKALLAGEGHKEALCLEIKEHTTVRDIIEPLITPSDKVLESYKRVWKMLKRNKLVKKTEQELFKVKGYYEVEDLPINEELLKENEEMKLHKQIEGRDDLGSVLCKRDTNAIYVDPIMNALDAFFDNVFIMHEDEAIRMNRLALLARYVSLIHKYAHLYYLFEDIPR